MGMHLGGSSLPTVAELRELVEKQQDCLRRYEEMLGRLTAEDMRKYREFTKNMGQIHFHIFHAQEYLEDALSALKKIGGG